MSSALNYLRPGLKKQQTNKAQGSGEQPLSIQIKLNRMFWHPLLLELPRVWRAHTGSSTLHSLRSMALVLLLCVPTIQDIAVLLWFRFHELSDHILLTTRWYRGMFFLYFIQIWLSVFIPILPGKIISGGLIKESMCLGVMLNCMNNSYGLSDCWAFVFEKELCLSTGLLLFLGVPIVQGIRKLWKGAGKLSHMARIYLWILNSVLLPCFHLSFWYFWKYVEQPNDS